MARVGRSGSGCSPHSPALAGAAIREAKFRYRRRGYRYNLEPEILRVVTKANSRTVSALVHTLPYISEESWHAHLWLHVRLPPW